MWGLPDHGKSFGFYPRYDGKDFDGETQSDAMDCMNCRLKRSRIEISSPWRRESWLGLGLF